eukprot:gene1166-15520_t
MLSKFFHRSTASTNEDGLNLWDLPRLHRAAYKNKIQKLQSLLKKRRVDINKKDVEGRTALHYGCLAGRIQVVRLILDADGKITIDRFGRSPIFMAIKNGHLDIVKVFYGIEFDFNRPDHAGTTPLHYAIFRKKMEIAEYLVKQVHVNVNARDMHISTPLHEAVLAGLPNVVLLLVKSGAETEIREMIGKTPLLLAIVKGEEECVEILLRYGAEIYRTRYSSLAEDKALQFRQKRIYEMLQTYRSKHERRIEFIDPNLLNIKSSLMTNEDGSVNAAMHEEDNEVVAFHENSHDSGLELRSSSRRIDRCSQPDNSVSLESQEVIEICINIEPQPAEEIPDLLFEEDGEEYSGEEIIDEQEISLVMADFETSSSNQPEVEQVTPSLIQLEAELTSAEPQPAEEIPDLLFEEDEEEYSEEEIVGGQEISLVFADFETQSSNQPQVEQVTPSLIQLEAELTSAEPQPAEEIPDLLFEEDEEEYSEEEIVGEQEISLVFADFETQSSNQPEVEQVTPSLIQLEAELTSAEPQTAEEIPDLLFEEDEEEYSEEEIVAEQEISLVFADFETQSSNQPEVEQVTPSLNQLEAELTSAELHPAEEIPDLLFEEDAEEYSGEEIVAEQEISLVFADFETQSSNQPKVEQVTPSLIQLEAELTSAEPQPAEEIPDLLFEEDEEEPSVLLEPPLAFSSSAPIDVNQGSSDPSEKPKQELPVYKEEASEWNNNVIQEKEKSLSINYWNIPTSKELVPKGDEGSTSLEQIASGSLEKQYPSGNNAASSKKLGPYDKVVLSRTGTSVYDEEAERLKKNCNQFVKLLEEIECSFNYLDDGFKRIESRLHGAAKQRVEKEDVVHENKRLALLNEELCKKVEALSKQLEQEVNMQKGMKEYQFNLETDNEQLRLQADKLMKDKNKDEVLLGLLEKENEELLVKSFKLNELEIQEKKTQEEMKKCLTELSKIEDIVKQKDEERTHIEEGIFQLQKKWETEHLGLLEAQDENDSLISKITDYRVKLDHLEREHKLTQEVSIEQRGTISSLNLRKADLSVEIDNLKFRLRSFVNLEEQNESLNEELRKAKNNLRAMENVYTVSMVDAIKFRGKYDEACYELEGLQGTIDLLSAEKKELSEKCDRLEHEMSRELVEHGGKLSSTDGKTKALESNLNLKNVPEDSSFWGNEAERSEDYKTNFD